MGLASKANIDDFRESPARRIAPARAERLGNRINIVEPCAPTLPEQLSSPGVALIDVDAAIEEQTGADLRWIRDPSLAHRGAFDAFVVHGHTITAEPDVRLNRIGIDAGAYAGGPLTAIGLEGEDRWFLAA